MRARIYIGNNFRRKYRNSLLKGIGKYLRQVRKVDFQDYSVEDLASDYKDGTLTEMQGIGEKTLQQLDSQLKADGYL